VIPPPITLQSIFHTVYGTSVWTKQWYQCVNQTVSWRVCFCFPSMVTFIVFFCLCLDPCTVCGSGIHIWLMQCLRGFAPEYASSRPLPLSYRFKIFTRKKNCECCSECNAELEHPNTTELEGKKICKLLVLLRCRLIGSTSNVLPKFLVSIHQESTS